MDSLKPEIELNEVCFITDKNGKKRYFQKIETNATFCTSCINYNMSKDKDLGLCDICIGAKIIFKEINEKDIEQMIYIIKEVLKHGTLNRGAYPSKEQAEERIKYLKSKYPHNCYKIDTCIYFPYGDPSKIREIKINNECIDN